MKDKLIIIYTLMDDNNVHVTYADNTTEIISDKQFAIANKHKKMKMAFIIPK